MLDKTELVSSLVLICFLAGTAGQEVVDVIVRGDARRAASVGRPSKLILQLIDENGHNVSSKDILTRLVVSTAPAPLSGTIEDRGGGCFQVMIVHEWVTSTAPEHGLTNVSVLLDGRHVGGSPFVYGTQHQFWVRPRKGTKEKHVKENQRTSSGKLPGAFVTLVATDEFALGTLVLAYSLNKVGSQFPFIAMITSKVSSHVHKIFRHVGIIVRDVDAVSNPFAAFKDKLEEKSWEQVYTKMQAWTLVEYERVVFLDADQLVVQNIDELFSWPLTQGFAAIPDVAPPIFFNSGFMLLEPNMKTFKDMQKKMHELPSYDDGDQGFLNAYFGQRWDRLPYVYNFVKSKTGNPEAFYWLLDYQWWSIKVFHMVGVKPWRCTRFRDCGGFPERVVPRLWALWWDYFLEMCRRSEQLVCYNPATQQEEE